MLRSNAWGALVSALMLSAVASPMWGTPPRDSFPLSTYPMFSQAKSARAVVKHLVGFSSESRHRVLPPELLGTDEIMQAAMTVARAVSKGQAHQLCRDVAIQAAAHPDYQDVLHIEVRTDTFDSVAYLQGERRPTGTRVHARCEVRPE